MRTTCPRCHRSFDVPDALVASHHARILQRRARALRTPAQTAAARANGRKGGRPPRKPAPR